MNDDVVVAEIIEPTAELEVRYTPAILTDNLGALEAYIDNQLAPFQGAKIDPEDESQIKEGRKFMADLNKLKEPIENERKRIKKAYEAPLKEFEARVKGITSKIDDARNTLKVQIDEADEAFKNLRYDHLLEEYQGCAGPIADVISFDAILDKKWLNRTSKVAKAENELYQKVEEALQGYNTLQTKELHHKDEVIKKYADTLDIISALKLEDELNEKDREMEAFKAAQEAANLTKKAAQAIEEADPSANVSVVGDTILVSDKEPEPEPVYIYSLNMTFPATQTHAREVAATLKSIGITGATLKCLGVVGDVK